MTATEIRRCTCAHRYQDAKYGNGMRVHNARKTNNGNPTGWRCTVCTKEIMCQTVGNGQSGTRPQHTSNRSSASAT